MGFENAGFHTVWANDIDKDACETHKHWSGAEVVCSDIKEIDVAAVPDCDIIIGGFPCQGFSLAGPRKIDDKRNSLYKFFVSMLEAKKPKVFVAENVKGILTLGQGKIIEAILADFASRGYRVVPTLVNALLITVCLKIVSESLWLVLEMTSMLQIGNFLKSMIIKLP